MIIFAAAITPLAFYSSSKEGVQLRQVSTGEPALIQKHALMPIVDLQKASGRLLITLQVETMHTLSLHYLHHCKNRVS
jgi:hypothetical protein